MLKLLNGDEVAEEFKKLRSLGTENRLAVAFWGDGACDALGITSKSDIRVICNLQSGATNPGEIETLMKYAEVRSNRRLHAKIYLVGGAAIIGSSNASSNGLALEGEEVSGWFEANVLTDDETFVAAAKRRFEALWASEETEEISEPMIAEAWIAWRLRRKARPSTRGKPPTGNEPYDLLEFARDNPEATKKVFVAAYNRPLGPKTEKTLEKARAKKENPTVKGPVITNWRNTWAYQGWDGRCAIPTNAWLIDVNLQNGPQLTFTRYGETRRSHSVLKVNGDPDSTLAHVSSAIAIQGTAIEDQGAVIRKVDRGFFQQAVKALFGSTVGGMLIPLSDVIAEIDKRTLHLGA